MINLIYERNGIEFQFIQVKNVKRLNKWIEALKENGPIKIVRVIVEDK